MNRQPIEAANDADLRLSLAAMQRAAQRARELAAQSGTAFVISHQGGDPVNQAAGGVRSASGRAEADRTLWRQAMIVMSKDKRWDWIEEQLRQPIASLD